MVATGPVSKRDYIRKINWLANQNADNRGARNKSSSQIVKRQINDSRCRTGLAPG
jgi:hypothetical protein